MVFRMKLLFEKKFYLNDVVPLLWLSIPLIFTGLIESSVSFFSTFFLAHLGHQELAAGALVNWLFATLMVILWGTLTAVSVLVAQKHGAKDDKSVSYILRDGLLLSLILVVPAFFLLWYISPVLAWMGQSPSVVLLAQAYLHGLAWGLLPDFITLVLLQFIIGLGHTRTSMVFTFCWVPVTIACNYLLVFGKFGLAKLGISGIGWGTSLSYWITSFWLIGYVLLKPSYRQYIKQIKPILKPVFVKELLIVGIPMGAMYCIEVGFFLMLSLLMGLQGSQQLAANQITLQYLGFFIAIVFSIAQAITVQMGHKLGDNKFISAARASYAGIFLSLALMLCVALCYWIIPNKLISVDLDFNNPNNANIINYVKQFLMVCAFFQILEAIRIALFGALRALKDTHFTLFASIISFWGIALPAGYVFAHYLKFGGIGFWLGAVVSALCSSSLLAWRFQMKMQQYCKQLPNLG